VAKSEGCLAKLLEGWVAKLEVEVAKLVARPLATAALCVGSNTTFNSKNKLAT
jgi:hypothetical protein